MKMHYLAAAAATVLTLAVAAPAAAQVGEVNINTGIYRSDITGDDEKVWGLGGSYASGGDGGIGFSIEGLYADASDADVSFWGAAGSLFSRNDMRAFGGTVTYISQDFGGPSDYDLWDGSLFAQIFQDNFTGTGRVFIGQVDGGFSNLEYRGVALDGDFFIHENAAVNLGIDFIDAEGGDGEFGGNIGLEWKRMNGPLGAFVEGSFSGDVTYLQVGVRGTLGGVTLRDRSRLGAPRTQLRDIVRFSGHL